MAEPDAEQEDIAELLGAGSREDAARALAPLLAGVLVRRASSDEPPPESEALERLPKALKSLVSARRRFTGGSVRAWILRSLADRAFSAAQGGARRVGRGSGATGREWRGDAPPLPADAEGEGLADDPKLREAAEWLLSLAGAEDRAALELLAVEGLDPRQAEGVLKEPAAVVEQRASRAFAALTEAVVEAAASRAPAVPPGSAEGST